MTNEQAIHLLHRLQDEQFDGIHGDERREALSMAVRALEGDGDTISRQQAIDEVINLWADKPFGNPTLVEIKGCIEALPPASECWRCNCKKMDTVHGLDGTVYTQDKDKQGWTGHLPSAQPQRKKGKDK